MNVDGRKPLVSVIIPTYNRGYIVSRAIRSVLNQTYQHVECIVVDDGSTDDTGRVVSTIPDHRIRYFRHAENEGKSASRNMGIAKSKGDFVAFLDSDDEYLPEKIEKSLNAFRISFGQIAMVASNYFLVTGSAKKIKHDDTENPQRIFPCLSGWVVRKEVFDRIGFFDTRMPVSQDVDFFQRFREEFKFYFLFEPLFNMYALKDGTFSDRDKLIRLRKKTLENLSKKGRLYALHLKYLAKDFRYIGQEKKTGECYLRAFFAYPVNVGYFVEFVRSYLRRRKAAEVLRKAKRHESQPDKS